jgi:hypothetical protein
MVFYKLNIFFGGQGKAVPDLRCPASERPAAQTIRCNRSPCPARWSPGPWGPCSVTCVAGGDKDGGGGGVQERRFTCRQELSPTMSIPVSERACLEPPPQGAEVLRRCLATRTCPSSNPAVAADMPAAESTEGTRHNLWARSRAESGGGVSVFFGANTSAGAASTPRQAERAHAAAGISGRRGVAVAAAEQGAAGSTEWVAQPWGPCSVTCGAGIRERRVRRLCCTVSHKMASVLSSEAFDCTTKHLHMLSKGVKS